MKKHLIIGAGAAGIAAAKMIRKTEDSDEITLISLDDKVYSRCMLYKVLEKERTVEKITFIPPNFFEKNHIRWVENEAITKIDTINHTVYLSCGAFLPFDRLLIATGAQYNVPPIPNFREAKNVYGFRDMSDVDVLEEALKLGNRVFVVGSGLVGLDVAYALLARGAKVTVAEMADRVMPLQTDVAAAKIYQAAFEKEGCTFKLGISASNSRMDENGRITSVILSNGEELPCDFVIMAAGVRPKIDFLKDSGIACERGVKVNEFLETSVPGIYAAGDVTGLSGVWPDAVEQGEHAGLNMCGANTKYKQPFPLKNTSNFYGIMMLSIGKLDMPDETYKEVTQESKDIYKKAVLKDGMLQGVLLLGDMSNAALYERLIKQQLPIGHLGTDVFHLSASDLEGDAVK